jgi:EmrB/QacA subfamily drug resistance transporter
LPAANPWVLVGVVMVGNFLGPLYSSVANIVLPNLVASFGSDVDTMEWVITGYMLGYSIEMPVAGWLADTFGRRRIYLIGLALFTLASVLTAFAWDASSLIGFRILQAVGGGIVSPTSMALIVDVVPAHERGRALGVWGLGMMLAPTFGPVVSGWIIDNLDDWRLIFFLGIPFGVAGLLLALAKLPHDDKRISRAPFDIWGFGLLTTALASFLIPLTQGNRLGWDDSAVRGSFVLAALTFAGFIWRELHTAHPMMDLSLFGTRTFSVAVGLRGVLGMAYYLPIFLLPLFTQTILGWPPTLSGLVLVPAGLTMAFLMPLAGTLYPGIWRYVYARGHHHGVGHSGSVLLARPARPLALGEGGDAVDEPARFIERRVHCQARADDAFMRPGDDLRDRGRRVKTTVREKERVAVARTRGDVARCVAVNGERHGRMARNAWGRFV